MMSRLGNRSTFGCILIFNDLANRIGMWVIHMTVCGSLEDVSIREQTEHLWLLNMPTRFSLSIQIKPRHGKSVKCPCGLIRY